MALANRDGGGSIEVLLGDGTGALTPQPLLAVAPGDAGRNLAVADFNGDHCDDIAHIDQTDRAVDIYMSTCTGMASRVSYTFDPVGPSASNGYRVSDDVVDLDGDGNLDLVVANSAGRGRNGNAIFVLPGNGDGTFGPVAAYPNHVEPPAPQCCAWVNEAVVYPAYVFASDLNGDGRPDLTTAANNDRPVAVLLQGGEPPDTTPPVISGTPSDMTAEATSADGATVTYTMPTATDDRDGAVASSQAVNGIGDGNTDPDWVITPGSLTVQLRSERAGGSKSGRTYTVTATCTDAAGNAASATTTVLAPHDMGKK